jgi:hypothetical protein
MRLKDHYMAYLVAKLSEEGVLNCITAMGGRNTVHQWIKAGKLTPRFRPHNKFYVFNDNEVADIIKEFSPGGKGWWSYS